MLGLREINLPKPIKIFPDLLSIQMAEIEELDTVTITWVYPLSKDTLTTNQKIKLFLLIFWVKLILILLLYPLVFKSTT